MTNKDREERLYMRVIAGKARRLQLKTVPGMETRPTQDRIKETLFNMIQHELYDARFLDLFAGSGGIGIEALSRGASRAVFIEHNKKACDCIRENLRHTKLDAQAKLIQREVSTALYALEEQGYEFDYIFMDPPYGKELEKDVLYQLSSLDLCTDDTLIIVESDLETEFSYLKDFGFYMVKEKIYKTNKHTFIMKLGE